MRVFARISLLLLTLGSVISLYPTQKVWAAPHWPLGRGLYYDQVTDTITSPFGPRQVPSGYSFHSGLDIRARPANVHVVYSVDLGYVWESGDAGSNGGEYIIIQNNGFKAGYFHLHPGSKLVVKDEPVSQDQPIARAGSSGTSEPHLHIGTKDDLTGLGWDHPFQNPLRWLPWYNFDCPFIVSLDSTHLPDYLDITVRVTGLSFLINESELDVSSFKYFLYTQSRHAEFEQNFDKYINISETQGGPTGSFLINSVDPDFQTVITLSSSNWDPDFSTYKEYYIRFNPTKPNAFPDRRFIGFRVKDTWETFCFNFNEWGNTSGISPVIAAVSRFEARSSARVVTLEWVLGETLPIKGVNIYRSESEDGGFAKINSEMYGTRESTARQEVYTYEDKSLQVGKTYYYRLEIVWQDGSTELSSKTVSVHVPAVFELSQNYPNPFNSNTLIRFSLPGPGRSQVTLNIFNMLGQKVRTLLDDTRSEGIHQIEWDGKDDRGQSLSSGIYFYKLQAGNLRDVKRVVLIK